MRRSAAWLVVLGLVAGIVLGAATRADAQVAPDAEAEFVALIGAVLAAMLLAAAVALERRRGTAFARSDRVAVVDDYRATAPPALPLTSGLQWVAAEPQALADEGGDGDVAAMLAPYRVSLVAARWRLDELAGATDAVLLVTTLAGRVRYATAATECTLGHGHGALDGVRLADLVHPDDAARLLDIDESHVAELRLRHGDGSWRHVDVTMEDRHDDPGVAGIVLRGADVTERRAVEAEVRNRVEHDPVTGLLARTTLLDRLAVVIESLTRGEGLGVLVVRLGGVDVVHEAHGPTIADFVVGAAADRLQHELGPSVLLGRYGEHDFAVVAPGVTGYAESTALARRMLDALQRPFVALAQPVTLVASVGATFVEEPDVSAARALQHAYVAMRAAERAGGHRMELFRPVLGGRAVTRLEDERALRRALEHEELCLQYQPIVRLASGAMNGVEALMRWQHPQRGLVPAAEFIPVAEEAGFIGELSWWALRSACAEAARWSKMASTFRVSVNVSARQTADPRFADLVFGALADADAPPSSLCLELTETSLLNDIAASGARLHTVREGGVTVAVDDFGTGYSSLGYLRQLPVDTVKIDRSFVKDLGHTPAGDAIASAVVGLAHGLGLATVAEGVETEAQAGALATLGCDHLQGYLCSPARPARDIDALFGRPLMAGIVDLRAQPTGDAAWA